MNFLENKPWILRWIFPILGGTLYPLGFPMGEGLSGSLFFSIMGFFLYLFSLEDSYSKQVQFKKILGQLLCFSMAYALVGYYWIPYTLKEFGNIPFPINTLMGALFSLIIVPQLLFFVLLLNFLEKKELSRKFLEQNPGMKPILLSFLLVIFENFIPQQFPAHLGHTWLNLAPYLGLATIFGVGIYSFISYWSIYEFITFINRRKINYVWIFSIIIFSFFNFLIKLPSKKGLPSHTLNTRFVQANVGNFMKLDSEKGGAKSMQEIYQRYSDLSKKPSVVFKSNIDLIIWPETAYPQLLNTSMMRVSPAFIPLIARNAVKHTQAHLFFGGYDKSGEENKNFYETEYNTAFLISPKSEVIDVYHKRLLIPFGESLPFGPFNPLFAEAIDNLAFFAKGQRFTLFELEKGSRFISAICYEILFSGYIRDYLNSTKNQPHFIINLTNDSWYGDTAEPFQHKHLAFWRAIENQIPIMRMTNTGITSILYPDGTESKQLPLFKQGILDIPFEVFEREATIFQRWGLLMLSILFVILLGLQALFEKIMKSKKT